MNSKDAAANAGFQMSDIVGVAAPGVIALVFGILAVIALALAVHRKSWGWGAASGVAFLVCAAGAVFLIVGAGRLMTKQVTKSRQSWVVTSADQQHHLSVPGHWKEDPDLVADAAIGVANQRREQYLMLFGYPRSPEVTLKEWTEIVNAEMASNMQEPKVGPLESRTVGEYPAMFSRLEGNVDGVDIVYHATYVQVPDEFVYILCWTLPSKERTTFPLFDKVVGSYVYTPQPDAEPVPTEAYDRTAPIPERVQVLLANQLGVPKEKVTPEATLLSLGADELDTVELVMTLEEEFDGEVTEKEAEKLKTVGDLIQWAETRGEKAEAPAVN